MRLLDHIRDFAREEDGVTAIEYALIASLISLALVGGATTLGGKLDDMFTFISGKFKTSAT